MALLQIPHATVSREDLQERCTAASKQHWFQSLRTGKMIRIFFMEGSLNRIKEPKISKEDFVSIRAVLHGCCFGESCFHVKGTPNTLQELLAAYACCPHLASS